MGMNFDFSSTIGSLFGGSSGGSGGMAGLLGDYASIKNGSYGKLMKAYYSETGSSSVKGTSSAQSKAKSGKSTAEKIIDEKIQRSIKTETAESKALTSVKSATDNLTKSIDKLAGADENSTLFDQKELRVTDEDGTERIEFGYDKESIYKALKDFVDSYNTVANTTAGVGNASMNNRVANMQNETKAKQQVLEQMGITIKADNTLSIDKDKFMQADMKKVQDLFQDKGYTNSLKASADLIRDTATQEQLKGNTYTYGGAYDSAYKSGSSFNSTL